MSETRGARVAAITAAAIGVGAGIVSGVVSSELARIAVRVETYAERTVRVLRVIPGAKTRVWIAGENVAAPGPQSLLFEPDTAAVRSRADREPAGHVKLGPVIERNGAAVLREVERVDRGTLTAGAVGRTVGWWYSEPTELGYRVEHTTFESELGPMDAWIIYPRRPRGQRWAVHVHGRGARPAEVLRGIAPFARAGITSVVIAYRNDEGQPQGHAGRYGLGISESRDVDAAIRMALDLGAARVTLVGWSMGGTASLMSATQGAHRFHIDGLVLDSPGVDWPDLLRAHARMKHVPEWIADWGMRMLQSRFVKSGEPDGIDFGVLTAEQFAESLSVPTLILASPDDTYVPWYGSRLLAELRPDLVKLVAMPGAGHVRLWNMDPERWESSVLEFVSGLNQQR